MPSFPTSVFAPSARSNGQSIDASHMNDVQDEIVAIEAGYRNGTAPLNSSGSTVVELFVAVSPPVARAQANAVAAIGSGANIALNFAAQRVAAPASMHSTVTNSSRITVPSSGVYMVNGEVEWSSGSTVGMREVFITLDDASRIAAQRQRANSSADTVLRQSVTTIWYASASTHFFTLSVYQDSGSTASLSSGLGQEFSVVKIR